MKRGTRNPYSLADGDFRDHYPSMSLGEAVRELSMRGVVLSGTNFSKGGGGMSILWSWWRSWRNKRRYGKQR